MDKIKVVIVNKQKTVKIPTGVRLLMRRCCHAVLELEGFEGSAEVDISIVDNQQIREAILGADMVVFATPLYYYGMSAQLKIVVDRFCAYNSSLHGKHMKSALLTVAWNADNWTFEALEAHYKTLVRYCGFKNQGMVLGYGCGSPDMTKRSPYVEEAYQMGKNL